MDAYDVSYRVSYESPRPTKRNLRRLLDIDTTPVVECQDTAKASVYYSIAIGVCSGLITTAVLLWLYVFHTHLEHRRRRLQRALRMAGDENSTSSKTSVVSSSNEGGSDDTVLPPMPPELYETSFARASPRMVRRVSNDAPTGIAAMLAIILENEPKVESIDTPDTSAPSETRMDNQGSDRISPRGIADLTQNPDHRMHSQKLDEQVDL